MSNAKKNGSGLPLRVGDADAAEPTQALQSIQERLATEIAAAGGEILPDPELAGSIGTTMFDLPGSQDNTVTVVLPRESTQRAASQALVQIKSRQNEDGRTYIGMVTAGPFAEPDSLRGDSHMLVTVATRGGMYQPPHHGRVQVTILGEKLPNGSLCPPRLRPLPNSPVFALSDDESAAVLKAAGDIRLGTVVGYDRVTVGVPSDKKFVLPRHVAVLGTTGGGKSTTVARLIQQAQAANMAVILLDVEGEYTHLHEPTTNADMLAALRERDLNATGIPSDMMTLYHLVGRETSNPDHPNVQSFSLQFAHLSPYAAAEIIGLTEPQETRFLRAYDIAKEVMRELGIFPAFKNAEQERIAMEIDEFERGYPRLTLEFMMDVVGACLTVADSKKEGRGKDEPVTFMPRTPELATAKGIDALRKKIFSGPRPDSAVSWRGVLGRLARLERLKVFDSKEEGSKPLNYKRLLKPGALSVIDLSDASVSELTNIVIADLLRGVQVAQDQTYLDYEKGKKEGRDVSVPTRTLVIIEEAHEFLSAERIEKTKILFQQVARIAKRGRKRWLGLVFVTQLPQHLPRQLFGLVNSYILHKITDAEVVSTLRRTVSGIDAGLWDRLTGLAPGQAIVSFPHMARPLLVSVDPTPAELRLID
jgi:DNA helicase HerA-like ATPase